MLRIIFFLYFVILNANVYAEEEYFLTLRNNKVNLRQGPSFDYPIKLFYKKKNLPNSLKLIKLTSPGSRFIK